VVPEIAVQPVYYTVSQSHLTLVSLSSERLLVVIEYTGPAVKRNP